MLIKVIYHDNKHDMVKPFLLDDLIDMGKVKMFHRSDGWAIIGFSPVRTGDERSIENCRRQKKHEAAAAEKYYPSKTKQAPVLHSKNTVKQNCWEFMKCGRQLGGMNVLEFGVCPASTLKNLNGIHSGSNAGRACWAVAGTMCHGAPQGTFAKKMKSCGRCPFYVLVKKEEEDRVATILLLEIAQSDDIVTLDISRP